MQHNRRIVAVFALAAALVTSACVVLYRSTASDTDAAAEAQHASHSPSSSASSASRNDRAAGLAVDPRIAQVDSESDLLGYFDQLETEARARGHLEDELARADLAGHRLLAKLPKERVARRMIDFGDRMRHVAVDLRVQPVLAELDAIRDKIAHETDMKKRQALITQYGQTSVKLDVPTARLAAAERLRTTLAAN